MRRPKIDEKPMATACSPRSQTLPSSPTHSTLSSSSSEFEFMTLNLSPRTKSSSSSATATADDLFYKGQLLPLHLSPRLSMVHSLCCAETRSRENKHNQQENKIHQISHFSSTVLNSGHISNTLLLSSSSTSSSSSTTTTRPSTSSSRPSSASDSTSTSSSARPSSATTIDDDDLKRLTTTHHNHHKKPNKYSSLSKKLSSVFRVKDHKVRDPENSNLPAGSSVKRAKEVLRKYLKKVKPLYEKLSSSSSSSSSSQKQKITTNYSGNLYSLSSADRSVKEREKEKESYNGSSLSHSFSGNLLYPRKKASVSSCPSSMRSSPNHSGILYRNGLPGMAANVVRDSSSMEELQSAIQGAIAHCKKSMVENKSMVSNEV